MADSVFKLTGADQALNMLKRLPPAIVSKRGGPVRAALRKGAVVIQKQEAALLSASLDAESTGVLLPALKVTRGKAPSDGKGERYLVRFLRKVYPRKSGKTVTTLQTAQLKEYGSEKQTAEPFIVPAFKSKAREAIETTTRELVRSIDRISKKLWGK